ncbi:MAG: protein-disulfide reductase DsbD [Gammaproteobacteria bacterium]|nr:protein-disulfide reductase DsbD [Gammaproteobacteria bacterium]
MIKTITALLLTLLLSVSQTPLASASDSAQEAVQQLSQFSQQLGSNRSQADLLTPDQAFIPSANLNEKGEIEVNIKIAEGHYLYQKRFKFSLASAEGLSLGTPQFAPAEKKQDPFSGEVLVYHSNAQMTLPIIGDSNNREVELKLRYQGCSEITGICYPPQDKVIPLQLSANGTATALSTESNTPPLSEQDQIAKTLSGSGFWTTILAFFAAGLLLALTPCVFPMIPILSSIIVGQGEKVTTRHAFTLSLVYVLAMAATYTVLGVAVGLSGVGIQAWFQNPWILSLFAALFVALSFSMFGFYELQMPNRIQSKLTAFSNKQHGGNYLGVAIMGFLSALIVGPCVTAPLVGALIYIADSGDALLGGVALFALGMGMGAPLIAIGTSAGKLLPRAGGWMDAVKAVFGVMILGMAIWMLERILPLAITMLLWALLLISSAIYMGALEPLKENISGWVKLWKGLGLALLLYGVMLMIGAAAGGTSLLTPLKGLAGAPVMMSNGNPVTSSQLNFRHIKGIDGLEQALALAKNNGQTVMLDFSADWCISCKEMESFTFSDATVQSALKNSLLLTADVTDNDAQDQALLKHFGLFGPPAILFFNKNSLEQKHYRVVGFMNAENFAAHTQTALKP